MKDYRPEGVDYSRSYIATSLYARLFGVMAVVVEAGFAVMAVLRPDLT